MSLSGPELTTFGTKVQHVVPELSLGLEKLFDFFLGILQVAFCLVDYYYNKESTTPHYAYCSFYYCAFYG